MSRLPAAGSARWVAVGAVASGVLTYVLLFVVGRATGPTAFAHFNGFWAAVVVTSVGVFLPLEQAVARRHAGGSSTTSVSGRGGREAGGPAQVLAYVLAAGATAVGVPVLALLVAGADAGLVAAAFAVAALGWAWQFPARGRLAGAGRLREYTGVVVVEGALRSGGAAALAIAGVQAPGSYALVVAVAGVGAGAAARRWARRAPHLVAPDGMPDERSSPLSTSSLVREVGGIAVALVSMQALLNSGNVVGAALADGPASALAGSLVAALAIVRAPVFVQQLAQAAYLPRVASAHHRRDRAAVRRVVTSLAAAVIVAGALAVAGAWLVGPWLVAISFGPRFTVTGGTAAVLALAVAGYLAAAVANDIAVALGRYRAAATAWLVGLAVALPCALLLGDVTQRVAVPMLAGSTAALAVLATVIASSTREGET